MLPCKMQACPLAISTSLLINKYKLDLRRNLFENYIMFTEEHGWRDFIGLEQRCWSIPIVYFIYELSFSVCKPLATKGILKRIIYKLSEENIKREWFFSWLFTCQPVSDRSIQIHFFDKAFLFTKRIRASVCFINTFLHFLIKWRLVRYYRNTL